MVATTTYAPHRIGRRDGSFGVLAVRPITGWRGPGRPFDIVTLDDGAELEMLRAVRQAEWHLEAAGFEGALSCVIRVDWPEGSTAYYLAELAQEPNAAQRACGHRLTVRIERTSYARLQRVICRDCHALLGSWPLGGAK